jgi:hypothetical protein
MTRIGDRVIEKLLQALQLARRGEWHEAHRVAQELDPDLTAAWFHAVLHKIEGDLDNSRYWYRRAGKMEHLSDEPEAELAAIEKTLTP